MIKDKHFEMEVIQDESENNEVTLAMYDKMAEFLFKFGINKFYKSEKSI